MDEINGSHPPDGVNIQIGIDQGAVVVIFPKAIVNIVFSKLAAYEFASAIMEASDQLGGPTHVSNN